MRWLAFLLLFRADWVGAADELVLILQQPEPLLLVAAEGKDEPRSVGSYALRLYRIDNSEHPRDHFLQGYVRTRDGVLERLLQADLDGDGTIEVVVVLRSVGSGSYLQADGFAFNGERLRWLAGASSLAADADPAEALREQLTLAHTKRPRLPQPRRAGDLWI